jgi:hypothetical protein
MGDQIYSRLFRASSRDLRLPFRFKFETISDPAAVGGQEYANHAKKREKGAKGCVPSWRFTR